MVSRKKQKGFTAFEMFFVLIAILALSSITAAVFVGIHFLNKVW